MRKSVWVEAQNYIGVERRGGGSGFRIFDRRRQAGALTQPPALSTIMRQLKAASAGMKTPDQWSRFVVRLDGAIGLASLQNADACERELNSLRAAILARPARAPLPIVELDAALERARLACEPR